VKDSEFLLGVLWSAWWLHWGHGEDTMAADMMRETAPIDKFRRLAAREEYHFQRGFWAAAKRRTAAQKGRRDHE
jgi:hypothetical protein